MTSKKNEFIEKIKVRSSIDGVVYGLENGKINVKDLTFEQKQQVYNILKKDIINKMIKLKQYKKKKK